MKRRTFAEVEAMARKEQRSDDIAEMCRILKHHLGMAHAADALWDEMKKPGDKRQVRQPKSPWPN